MNWGKSIIVAFGMFAIFIATLVTVCMRQDVALVSKDYYREELAYQQHIARVSNASQLTEKPSIGKTGDFLQVGFASFNKIEKGSLELFRPSDPKMDRTFILGATEETTQSFSITGLDKGMYRVRMRWRMDGKEYFVETVINI